MRTLVQALLCDFSLPFFMGRGAFLLCSLLSAQGAVLLLLGIWRTGNPCAGLTQTSVLQSVPGQRHQAEAFPFCWNVPTDFLPQKPVRVKRSAV